MALVLHDNVGFVTVRPTADPAGANTTIDGSSVVVKDTAPAGARKITEIGWYRGSGTNTANFEVALYSESAGVAATRLNVNNTNSSAAGGWIIVTVNWNITPGTAYWLGLQMDAHTGSSTVDSATSGGSGTDILTSQTTLADPYGGGAVADADGMYAIYALVTLDKEVLAGIGALTLTGFAPTVSTPNPINVLAGLGALSFTGFAPLIQVSINVNAGIGVVTYDGFAPTVSVTANVNISAGVGSMLFEGFAPSVQTPIAILAGVGQYTYEGLAPTIQTPLNVYANLGEITFNGFSPVVEAPRNINAGLGEVSFSGFAPSIDTPVNISAGLGQLIFIGYAPSVATGDAIEVLPGTGVITFIGLAPDIYIGGGNIEVLAGLGVITFTGFAPTVSDGTVIVEQPSANGQSLSTLQGMIKRYRNHEIELTH